MRNKKKKVLRIETGILIYKYVAGLYYEWRYKEKYFYDDGDVDVSEYYEFTNKYRPALPWEKTEFTIPGSFGLPINLILMRE